MQLTMKRKTSTTEDNPIRHKITSHIIYADMDISGYV